MPLIVCVVNGTEFPPWLIAVSVFEPECSGSIPCIPFEPEAAVTWKPSTLPFQVKPLKPEASRPCTQDRSCLDETTGERLASHAQTTACVVVALCRSR